MTRGFERAIRASQEVRKAMRNVAAGVLCAGWLISGHAPIAEAQIVRAPAADADVVYVRSDCAVDGLELPNCAEGFLGVTLPDGAAAAWLWDQRRPTASRPVTIDVGPGTFAEGFFCPGDPTGTRSVGWVSVRGHGRGVTTLGSEGVHSAYGAEIRGCEGLEFINLSLMGANAGVLWLGGGDARWTDVDLRGQQAPAVRSVGWFDACLSPEESNHQEFYGATVHGFGSRSIQPSAAFFSLCARSRFYGGDFRFLPSRPGYGTTDSPYGRSGAIVLAGTASLEVYGSSVRVGTLVALDDRGEADRDGTLFGVTVDAAASVATPPHFRMHGGIVSMNPRFGDTSTVGLRVLGNASLPPDQNAYANTVGTAFVLNPSGAGTATRLEVENGGRVDAPLLWQAGPNPPSSANGHLASVEGQGLFVETDCEGNGDCDSGSESHLMVFDADCIEEGGSPWRNMMTKSCRGTPPLP